MRRLEALTIGAVCLTVLGVGVSAKAQQAGAQQAGAQQAGAQQVEPQQAGPQVMGTVATRDALVTGVLEVQGERAELVSNASVTAHDHTAAVSLARGGEVLVCATSQFHLLHSGTGQSLLLGLDRGALEIHGASDPQDVILTPDMMFKVEHAGTLDLGLRVTRDGDTCVDNAGAAAPVLMLSDAFSSASYRVMPGQHVLFEHGDLHQVVDNEPSPCGCPAMAPPKQSLAGLAGPAATAAEHPFPAAASEGLAPEAQPANSAPAGEKHTQVAATLAYGPGEGPPPSEATAASASPASAGLANGSGDGSAAPPVTPPGAHSIFHSIGHFLHKLFHPGKAQAATGR
jgi:hypothetical protein